MIPIDVSKCVFIFSRCYVHSCMFKRTLEQNLQSLHHFTNRQVALVRSQVNVLYSPYKGQFLKYANMD